MNADQLDKVAFVARTEENKAAGALQQKRQAVEQSQQRLGQLEAFRQEYENRLQGMASSGMDARQLADYRHFLVGLNQAIVQQGNEVTRGEAQVSESREDLLDRSLRRGSLDELVSRTRVSLQQDLERKEQRLSDERAMLQKTPD